MPPSKLRLGLSESLSNNKALAMPTMSSKVIRTGSTKSDSVSSPIPRSQKSTRSVGHRSSFEDRSPRINGAKLVEPKHTSERRLSNASNNSNDVDRMFESKAILERRMPKPGSITPDRQSRRVKLNEVEESLEWTKEQLVISETQNTKLVEELKNVKELANVAHEKLKEAQALQKRAEESFEIEKFRSDELEQIGIEAAKKKEEELENECESIKNDLFLEVEKVVVLSDEISHLKSLLDSKNDGESLYEEELIKKLDSEDNFLKCELERTKKAEKKLVEMEFLVEKLSVELERAHFAEHDSIKIAEDSKKKSELLEIELVKAEETLASFQLQLEERNTLLRNSEYEIASFTEKIELMQNQINSSSESKSLLLKELESAESEVVILQEKVKFLETELTSLNKEKYNMCEIYSDTQKKESSFGIHLEKTSGSKNLLSTSLAPFKEVNEKNNSSLKDALFEVDVLRGKLQSVEIELTCYKVKLMESERNLEESQQDAFEMGQKVDSLKSEIQSLSQEKLKALNEMSEERTKLMKELDDSKKATEKVSTETRELQERLSDSRVENENLHVQVGQLRVILENTKENQEIMLDNLDKAGYDIICLKKDIEKLEIEAKEKQTGYENAIKTSVHELASLKTDYETLKAKKVDIENEVQYISQGNVELKMREAASVQSIHELSPKSLSSLNELSAESVNGEKEQVLDSEKPNKREKGQEHPCIVEKDRTNCDDWNSCNKYDAYSDEIEKGDKLVEESDSKVESSSLDKMNGSPLEQKKKKPLFKKFGNLLKKRSPQNHL